MEESKIMELLNRRRNQVVVHSCIYYRFDENLISDGKWTRWAKEVFDLQNKYPEIAKRCVWAKEFEDFDYSTGMNLPIDNSRVVTKAKMLIDYVKECKTLTIRI